MGISTSPDEYQSCMMKVLGGFHEFIEVYLDDILVYSETFEDHLNHLKLLFVQLSKYGITLNLKKCKILKEEINYLGFSLTKEGIKPQSKKVDAILKIKTPTTKKQVRRFLGMVTYYREMIKDKAALCAPLNKLTSKNSKFLWEKKENDSFLKIKKALSEAILLNYPDYNKVFDIYADDSGKQIGGLIRQEEKILACFSRSLSNSQRNYTTMELELLSIIEILKEYRTMLLGFPIIVHTDHKNLIYPKETSLRIKRWKLILQDYNITMKYIMGKKNIGADIFSRIEYENEIKTANKESLFEDSEFLLHGKVIKKYQLNDIEVSKIIQSIDENDTNNDYKMKSKLGSILLTYKNKILIPTEIRLRLVIFYHSNLLHPGVEKTYQSMKQIFYWPGMKNTILRFNKTCITCKKAKLHGGKQDYGKIPAKKVTSNNPFDVVHVDLIGPFDGYYALTAIESEFRWIEVNCQENKTSKTTAENFDFLWLCRYPRPYKVIHDQGGEFTGNEFQSLLISYGIKSKPISSKNPQANALCERVHLELLNMVRCYPDLDWKVAIQYAAFSLRTSYHSILNASPAQLVFGEDLLTRTIFSTNWHYLSKRRYHHILYDNTRENSSRIEHLYQIGDVIMLRVPKLNRKKTSSIAEGPYIVKKVNDNGTLLIDKGTVTEIVSIRRVFSC